MIMSACLSATSCCHVNLLHIFFHILKTVTGSVLLPPSSTVGPTIAHQKNHTDYFSRPLSGGFVRVSCLKRQYYSSFWYCYVSLCHGSSGSPSQPGQQRLRRQCQTCCWRTLLWPGCFSSVIWPDG